MTHDLSHERLDVYRLARSVARWVRATPFPRGDAPLKDQARRAADSVVLGARQEPKRRRCEASARRGRGPDGPDNLAEGAYRSGKDRQRHLRIAMGSAAEACAVFDLVDLPDGPARQAELRRVVASSPDRLLALRWPGS